jgi:hypothetical protein
MDFTGNYIESTYQKVLHIHSGSIYDGTGSYVSPTISGSLSVIGDIFVTSGSVYVDGQLLGSGSSITSSYALDVDRSLLMDSASYASYTLTSSYASEVDRSLLMDSSSYSLDVDRSLLMESSSYTLYSLTSSYALDVDRSLLMESSSHTTDPFVSYINQTNYFTGSQYISGSLTMGVSSSVDTLVSSSATFYLNEGADTLMVNVVYSDGTVKSGSVDLF